MELTAAECNELFTGERSLKEILNKCLLGCIKKNKHEYAVTYDFLVAAVRDELKLPVLTEKSCPEILSCLKCKIGVIDDIKLLDHVINYINTDEYGDISVPAVTIKDILHELPIEYKDILYKYDILNDMTAEIASSLE